MVLASHIISPSPFVIFAIATLSDLLVLVDIGPNSLLQVTNKIVLFDQHSESFKS